MKTITIGTLRMTVPAFITAVCGVVIGLSLVFAMPHLWYTSLMVSAAFFVGAYNVNCATVGKCNTWAWLLTAIYIVYTLAVVIVATLRNQVLTEVFSSNKKI